MPSEKGNDCYLLYCWSGSMGAVAAIGVLSNNSTWMNREKILTQKDKTGETNAKVWRGQPILISHCTAAAIVLSYSSIWMNREQIPTKSKRKHETYWTVAKLWRVQQISIPHWSATAIVPSCSFLWMNGEKIPTLLKQEYKTSPITMFLVSVPIHIHCVLTR